MVGARARPSARVSLNLMLAEIKREMVIQGALTEADYVSGKQLCTSKLFYWVVLVTLFTSVVKALNGGETCSADYLFMGSVVTIVFFELWLFPFFLKRVFRKNREFSVPFSVEVRDNGLLFATENAKIITPWSDISKWRHNKSTLVIMCSFRVEKIIPKHFFESNDDFVLLLNLLIENCAKKHE